MKCKECEEKPIAAGQAFREYICGHCFEVGMWSNTATPKICPHCSKKFKRCERCLKKIE